MFKYLWILLISGTAQAVVFRVDPSPVMTTAGNVAPGGFPALYAVPGASIQICTDAACTIPATTFTDATGATPCPVSAPVTLAGTSLCTPFAGPQGQFGFWLTAGTNYYYKVIFPSTQSFGPFPITSSAAVAGVSSFNARTGAVVPTTGDYTAAQITGPVPTGTPGNHQVVIGTGAAALNTVPAASGTNLALFGTTGADPFWSVYGFPSSVSANQFLISTAIGQLGAVSGVNCPDSAGNHLNMTLSPPVITCGTTSSGGGGGTGLTICLPGSLSGSAYTCPGAPAGFTLSVGATIVFIPDVTSTVTNPTLSVNSTAVKQIIHGGANSSALAIGELVHATNGIAYIMVYDGAFWETVHEAPLAGPNGTISITLGPTGTIIDTTNQVCQVSAACPTTGIQSQTSTANQAITAVGNTILCNGNSVQVTPNANLTLTSTPTILAGVDGARCTIQNLSTTNTLTLQDEAVLASTNLLLGGANITIGAKQALTIRYNASLGKWVRDGIVGGAVGAVNHVQISNGSGGFVDGVCTITGGATPVINCSGGFSSTFGSANVGNAASVLFGVSLPHGGLTDIGDGIIRYQNNAVSSNYAVDTATTANTARFRKGDNSGPGGTVSNLAAYINTVTFSATPAFDASLGGIQSITLTGNVTSSTFTNPLTGQIVNFHICQDGTGSRTFTWPGSFHGTMTIGSTLSKCSDQQFWWDGSAAWAMSQGVTNQ